MKIAIVDTLGLAYDGDTLTVRGLGGSESAVILISKELSNLGFDVTVYNNCLDSRASPGNYNGVTYIDHSQHCPTVEYDIFISSRTTLPFRTSNKYEKIAMLAKKRILWMHDTFCEGDSDLEAMLVHGYIDEVFTLSDFHSWYVTSCDHGNKRNFEMLKHKFFQTRNGAVKHIPFVNINAKDPMHFVYNASATKGLIPLVNNIWPNIKIALPSAHLTCIGGFYRHRDNAQPDAQELMVNKLIELAPNGVTFTGVIPQFEIAEILANASMMPYPTAFPETFGISSLESLLYNTPIITNTFGALEETAIDTACYKIPYSSTNNALFNNINETEQAMKFVKTVVDAVRNPYLLQQKQNYCNVVDDVYSWRTVAIQWKQHFYNILGEFLDVETYHQADEINQSVTRIYGRRFNNKEDRKKYISYNHQRNVVVVSPVRNAQDYIRNHCLSVWTQDYTNWQHYITDDNSNDDTTKIIQEELAKQPQEIQDRVTVTLNDHRKGAANNQVDVFNIAADDDIIMLLDGDDWLVNNPTIFHMYNNLYSKGHDFTYGSMQSLADDIPLIAQDYPPDVIQDKTYRSCKFNWGIPYTHLRTVSGKLARKFDTSVVKDSSGEFMKSGADNPMFYKMIEDSTNPKAIKEIIVNYNDINPLNDYKVNAVEQTLNSERSYMTNKKILIGIPTNKYIEPETMKSVYDLIVPDGYETEFQFFYGYQIDQIRNLIGKWAKNYDYLFSVDSDIVLQPDTLVKMLKADKDVISGLYIQRIPDTHTLEVYMDSGNGGCTNIPITAIQGKGIVEIAGCGMGCVLINSNVFRQLEYPHFYYQSALDHKDTISEDIYFCKKARAHGFTIWADESIRCDHIGNTKFVVTSDKEEIPHLQSVADRDLLPALHVEYLKKINSNPKVIYDIGACVLHWTRHASSIWPEAEFCLVDATMSVQPFLETSGHKWKIAVLSDSDNKEVEFYENSNDPGGNSYYLENTEAYNNSHKTNRTGYTLDYIAKQNNWPLPDMIKLDVQGAELDVLRGSTCVLANVTDIILEAQHVDYNKGAPKSPEVIEYLQSIGFELVSNFINTDVDGDYHFKKSI